MIDTTLRRHHRRELAERMQVQYAGALPPGQVLSAISRAEIMLARSYRHPWSTEAEDLCETIARHLLTRQIATHPTTRES